MIFKTKNQYKNEIADLSIENIKLRCELNIIKNENERLKLKQHGTIQVQAETDYYNIANEVLHEELKHKVLKEIEDNFEDYVKLSPIINSPCEMCYKQFATIQIERIK